MDIFMDRDPLQRLVLSASTVRAIGRLDEFKGRWSAIGALAPERLRSLQRIATIESVGSSTRIEGARLNDDAVERLLTNVPHRPLRSRDEQEVAGYGEVMDLVFESWRDIGLTENHIRQLHGTMLKHSDKDARHRGSYKKVANHLEAFDASGGSLGVVFETATPFEAPGLMGELVGWTRAALERQEHHPVLVVAVFVLRFLAIHPFEDGNGRLSRALTTLLLLQCGYEYVPYSSLERVFEENKADYYRSLRRAQATLDRDESQLADWIAFFLACLQRQSESLERKVGAEGMMAPLAPLSAKILEIVLDHGRITVRDATALTGANRNTVKAHLQGLVISGRLVRCGRGRGTWYEKP